MLTLTGANADHRLLLRPSGIAAAAAAIARHLGADLPPPSPAGGEADFCAAAARDLATHKGRAIVVAGPTLAAEIHALCHWINAQAQAPVDYFDLPGELAADASLADLVSDCDAGKVDSLVILGCNPAYELTPGSASRTPSPRRSFAPTLAAITTK